MIFPLIILGLFLWSFVMMLVEIQQERTFPKFFFKFVVIFGIAALFFLTH